VPIPREPLYTPRRDLVEDYPTNIQETKVSLCRLRVA
jgi:hypothetical protein